jgi:hypothetical protein
VLTSRTIRFAGLAATLSAGVLACSDLTSPLDGAANGARMLTAQATGDVYVMVQTEPYDATVQFSFTHDFGTSSSPQVPSPFVLTSGHLRIFNSVAPGSYSMTQTAPDGWQLIASGDGHLTECWDEHGLSSIDLATGMASIEVVSGGFVVCTFVSGPHSEEPDSPALPSFSLSAPRGIGFWKKAASCDRGRTDEAREFAHAVIASESFYPFGTINSMGCADAANLLGKRDLGGRVRANDGAYKLAAQLLAARLNEAAGVPVSECLAAAMVSAQELLSDLGFNGLGDYLPPKGVKTLRKHGVSLAELLDEFNNGKARVLSGNCG